MKPILKFLTILPLLALCGCGSILPKNVEFWQSKVKPVPTISPKALETQRQAAQYVAQKAQETKEAAIADECPPEVLTPAGEAATVAQALSESVGPPVTPWTKPAQPLADKLGSDLAKLNNRVTGYEKTIAPEVGKKIEGTGLIQMGYFSYLACLLGLGALVWAGVKIYGMVNPAVGLGSNVVGSVASSVLSKGVSEIVAGGERFKSYLESSPLTSEVKNYVEDLFVRGHMEAQSQDVQKLVSNLTAQDPSTHPSAPPAPAPKTDHSY